MADVKPPVGELELRGLPVAIGSEFRARDDLINAVRNFPSMAATLLTTDGAFMPAVKCPLPQTFTSPSTANDTARLKMNHRILGASLLYEKPQRSTTVRRHR